MGSVALTLTLITRHTIVAVRTDIRHLFDARLAQLVADAQAWIASNPDRVAALETGGAIELDASATLPPGATGLIRIVRDSSGLLVRAKIQSGKRIALAEIRPPQPREAAP